MTRQSTTQPFHQQTVTVHPLTSGRQRKCTSCGQKVSASGKCTECTQKKKGTLQRRAVRTSESLEVPSSVHQVLRSPGQHLDPKTQTFMESRFGQDFSQVRVHANTDAEESAQALNALAYTVGNHIVFGKNHYSPSTSKGKHLLAHELAHVTQQQLGGATDFHTKLTVSPAHSAREYEAEQAANAVVSGKQISGLALKPVPSAIQRMCYRPAQLGSIGGCIAQGGDITDAGISSNQLYLSEVNCDHLLPGEEARLRAFASSIGPTDRVDIHGFASEEGPTDFNENLSCARAHEARLILIHEGVSASQIELYSHGATLGTRTERRSVVVIPRTVMPLCGPDATDWYVNQVNTASTDADVLRIRTQLAAADRLARSAGTTAQQVADGAVTGRVILQERDLGARAPARNPTITSQLATGEAAGIAAGLALLTSPIDTVRIGNHLRTAANEWRTLVNHGARYDFKAHTMRRPSTANCPDSACPDSITLCPGSESENCYLTDLPGNLFYAQIGRFIGWSELTLQLGSQFAQLTGTASWDPPQDTNAIHLGFSLPVPMTASDLCSVLPPARASINTVPGCDDCTEPTTAAIR